MSVGVCYNHLRFLRVAITSSFRLYEQNDELIIIKGQLERYKGVEREAFIPLDDEELFLCWRPWN